MDSKEVITNYYRKEVEGLLNCKTKIIEYVNSEDVQTSSQLNEIFRDKCGIIVDGRIYTSIDSILEVDYLNHRYEAMCDFESQDDFDNELKTPEFKRIGALAYAIRFSNQQL